MKVTAKQDAAGGTQVLIPDTQSFTPGKYKVEIVQGDKKIQLVSQK